MTFVNEFKDRCLTVNDTLCELIGEQNISEEKIETDPLQIFSCNELSCDYKAMLYYDYCQHRIIHDRRKNLTELYCASQLVNERKCGITKRTLQKNEKGTECSICGRQLTSEFKLLLHFLKHAVLEQNFNQDTNNYFFCEFCGEIYHSKNELKEHSNRLHAAEVQSEWQCQQCDEKFEDDTDVLCHERTANHFESSIPENGFFECPVCSEQYTNVYNLLTHSICHLIKQYSCRDCKKQFISKGSLRSHLETHSDFIVTCNFCKKIFINKYALQKHLLLSHGIQIDDEDDDLSVNDVIHTTEQSDNDDSSHITDNLQENKSETYECKICKTIFSDSLSLEKHMLHKHEKPFSCTICGISFRWKYHLRCHIIAKHKQSDKCKEVHAVKAPYKCTYLNCNRRFRIKSSMTSHLRVHLGIRTYNCEVCERKFLDITSLKRHRLLHTGEKPFTCDLCGKKFRRKHHLEQHTTCRPQNIIQTEIKTENLEETQCTEQSYKCQYCEESFNSSIGFNNHIRRHLQPKSNECQICNRTFSDSTCLKRHMLIHTGEKPFACDLCNQKFRRKHHLEMHLASKHNLEQKFDDIKAKYKVYKCDTCRQEFTQSKKFKKHLREHSSDAKLPKSQNLIQYGPTEEAYKCSYDNCDESFGSKIGLNNHIRGHVRPKSYNCEICMIKLSNNSSLRRHLRIHMEKKPFTCDLCSEKFSGKRNLQQHITYKHKSEAKSDKQELKFWNYKCEICEFKFIYFINFKQHLLIHTGKTSFSCDICNDKFRIEHDLKRHMRSKHTGILESVKLEKPDGEATESENLQETEATEESFKCTFSNCNKSFDSNLDLTKHVRCHVRPRKRKSYQCEICKKTLTDATGLRRHMLLHTGEKPFTCDLCSQKFRRKHHLMDHIRFKHKLLR